MPLVSIPEVSCRFLILLLLALVVVWLSVSLSQYCVLSVTQIRLDQSQTESKGFLQIETETKHEAEREIRS